MSGTVRKFESGATRDGQGGKYEFARFLDPRVLKMFAAYMHRHRLQADGSLRDPDNWKRGIPLAAYKDSLVRHMFDLWEIFEYGSSTRPEDGSKVDLMETLCAILFNTMGYMFETLKAEARNESKGPIPPPLPGG